MHTATAQICLIARLVLLTLSTSFLSIAGPVAATDERVSGDAVIRGKFGDSEIAITTTDRLAGAIHSLTWNGQEFIDSHDHGRQLQSALSFDAGSTEPFWAERYNPTEAGSRRDGTGETSTSRLIRLQAGDSELNTTVQMAYWLAPGEKSFGRSALNQKTLSDHRLSKQVRIGTPGPSNRQLDNVIAYDVTYHLADDKKHRYAQFEALTGYMPPEFSEFWTLNPVNHELQPLSDGPGEQSHPVIFSTPDRQHAMGILSLQDPAASIPAGAVVASDRMQGPSYGRFRFAQEQVVKWNCVFRLRSDAPIPGGDYRFAMFVAVGTLEDVAAAFVELSATAAR